MKIPTWLFQDIRFKKELPPWLQRWKRRLFIILAFLTPGLPQVLSIRHRFQDTLLCVLGTGASFALMIGIHPSIFLLIGGIFFSILPLLFSKQHRLRKTLVCVLIAGLFFLNFYRISITPWAKTFAPMDAMFISSIFEAHPMVNIAAYQKAFGVVELIGRNSQKLLYVHPFYREFQAIYLTLYVICAIISVWQWRDRDRSVHKE